MIHKIQIGDHLLNPFLDDIVITNHFKDSGIMVFSTVDTRLRSVSYSYENIYHRDLNPDDICDEEMSFLYWAKDNREYIEDNLEIFDYLKDTYMQGFAMGFQHKKDHSYKEQMQK